MVRQLWLVSPSHAHRRGKGAKADLSFVEYVDFLNKGISPRTAKSGLITSPSKNRPPRKIDTATDVTPPGSWISWAHSPFLFGFRAGWLRGLKGPPPSSSFQPLPFPRPKNWANGLLPQIDRVFRNQSQARAATVGRSAALQLSRGQDRKLPRESHRQSKFEDPGSGRRYVSAMRAHRRSVRNVPSYSSEVSDNVRAESTRPAGLSAAEKLMLSPEYCLGQCSAEIRGPAGRGLGGRREPGGK